MTGDIKQSTSEIIQSWQNRGVPLDVPGTASTMIWREGDGPAVVCLHGVPASAYLYRKILPELASRGLEGITLDFPGLGLANRPKHFDYSWSGLSQWLEKALDAAGIERFHLVVHDIGGPIGFDLINRVPDRILSLTALDTMVYTSKFVKPWVMRLFSVPVLGWLCVKSMNSPLIVPMFRWKGIQSNLTYSEIRAYGKLLVMNDGGRAFREIMASFEISEDFENRILLSLRDRGFPAQLIWAKNDSELPVSSMGEDLKEVLDLKDIILVEGKHFLQEDSPTEIAEQIVGMVGTEL